MKEAPAIQFADHAQDSCVSPRVGFVRLGIDLAVFDETLGIVADVPDQPLRMSDIVPLTYQICDRMVGASVRHSEALGQPVSCRKGCKACCEPPVLISVPEAFRLSTDIASLAGHQQLRVNSALVAAQKRMAAPKAPANACPLLAEQVCSVYDFRPCVCRAFLPTYPPELCDPHETRVISVPAAASLALRLWAAELEDEKSGPVLLSAMLGWCDENHARGQRTWPGPQMVRQLFDILSEMALQAR